MTMQPDHDAIMQQNVLIEEIRSQFRVLSEKVESVEEKIDRVATELSMFKADVMAFRIDTTRRLAKIENRLARVEDRVLVGTSDERRGRRPDERHHHEGLQK
jgi:hypothetical protein